MTRFENALRLAKSNTAFDGGSIGTLGEKTLHSVLKYYIEPCDDFHEVAVGRYVADIMRDGCITEIQTRGFDTMRAKLGAFLKEHPVTVVHPIPAVREYYTVDRATGETSAKRKSPKKGNVYDVFPELYKIKMLLGNANLYFHFILVDVTEYRCTTEKSRRNRKGIMRIDRIPTRIAEEAHASTGCGSVCALRGRVRLSVRLQLSLSARG